MAGVQEARWKVVKARGEGTVKVLLVKANGELWPLCVW